SVIPPFKAFRPSALRHAARIAGSENIPHRGASRANDTNTTWSRVSRCGALASPPNAVSVHGRFARHLCRSSARRASVPASQRDGLRTNSGDGIGARAGTAAWLVDRLRGDAWPGRYGVAQAACDCDSSRRTAASGQPAPRERRRARSRQGVRFDEHVVPSEFVWLRATAADGWAVVLSP